ncbi:HAMP domain-containing sensor histidine kinase [Pedobacter gandavensis]|uniref:sensor histidine kinase n=1 Tax=Pedobacter gandavensis TaxID=2679963 RepID=UPI0024799656|nr:HAMP domain-containing sensor histidine kinase [Pedobacter gandavensis]WGQ10808.1 HAMP domain-containing sensor histidine kinase [Pedobacter gandavensis]
MVKAQGLEHQFILNVLTRAEIQTVKMTTMIHDFLNVSRLEHGKMTLSLSQFSLKELMEETISEAIILAPNHLLEYSGCPDVELCADRNKIAQVLTNLLNNALKYSGSGTTVTIICQLANKQLRFSIADQGVGISKADQLRLFERFYRVNDQQTMQVSGFGIGLYLVAEILKLHGSSIKLDSKLGEGAVFSFSLPLA